MWRVFFTSAIVAVVVRSAMGWCKNGNCGHFGSGGFIIWDISGLHFCPLFNGTFTYYTGLFSDQYFSMQWSRGLFVPGIVPHGNNWRYRWSSWLVQ